MCDILSNFQTLCYLTFIILDLIGGGACKTDAGCRWCVQNRMHHHFWWLIVYNLSFMNESILFSPFHYVVTVIYDSDTFQAEKRLRLIWGRLSLRYQPWKLTTVLLSLLPTCLLKMTWVFRSSRIRNRFSLRTKIILLNIRWFISNYFGKFGDFIILELKI